MIITAKGSAHDITDIEDYSLISIAVLGYDISSQITVANVTLPIAVLSKVKIFVVQVLIYFFLVKLNYSKKMDLHTVSALFCSSLNLTLFFSNDFSESNLLA